MVPNFGQGGSRVRRKPSYIFLSFFFFFKFPQKDKAGPSKQFRTDHSELFQQALGYGNAFQFPGMQPSDDFRQEKYWLGV